jgi:aspartate carbamoyltransferase catalytic subunit
MIPIMMLWIILGCIGVFRGRDILSILDFDRGGLMTIFETAVEMEGLIDKRLDILSGKILALLFFEPSTRTMFSFQTAMYRLGGECLVFSDARATSIAKGETLADTVRMMDGYADGIVIRHSAEGAAEYAAELAEAPVINAGDGTHHHPTQAMIDLYTIWRVRGGLDGLVVGVLGDLKYGRAATSFIYGISLFRPRKLYLISPSILMIRDEVRDVLDGMGIKYEEVEGFTDILGELDILYVTRIQKERFPDPADYERVKGSYRISRSLLTDVKDELMILHPLPRVDEISIDVDDTKYAYYFQEARNGIPIRMALLRLVLGG